MTLLGDIIKKTENRAFSLIENSFKLFFSQGPNYIGVIRIDQSEKEFYYFHRLYSDYQPQIIEFTNFGAKLKLIEIFRWVGEIPAGKTKVFQAVGIFYVFEVDLFADVFFESFYCPYLS